MFRIPRRVAARSVVVLACLTAVLVGGPVGRPTPARGLTTEAAWTPGVSMVQAVVRVMAAARELQDKTEYGYVSRGCFLATLLKVRESSRMTYQFEKGEKYLFLAGGDDDATDVDLTITDADGKVVAKDTDADPSAVVTFSPADTGKYTVDLKLFASRQSISCFCAVAVLRKGGYDVPIDNLSSATAKLIKSCESVFHTKGVDTLGFEHGDGQWAVFGAVIKEGEDNLVTDLRPGAGLKCYLAAADDLASDIDLYLLDTNGSTLKSDTDPDPVPRVVYHTEASTNYGLRTKAVKTQKGGATMVLTTGLQVN